MCVCVCKVVGGEGVGREESQPLASKDSMGLTVVGGPQRGECFREADLQRTGKINGTKLLKTTIKMFFNSKK